MTYIVSSHPAHLITIFSGLLDRSSIFMTMKRLATFLLLITSLTAFGQSSIELPFNPDADGNGFISVSDVLNVLSTYDTMFSAGEVLVNGTGLSSFIAETDATIDSLSAAASVCIELQHLEAFEEYLNNSVVALKISDF